MTENSEPAPVYGTPPSRPTAGDPAAYTLRAGLRSSGFFLLCGAAGGVVTGFGIAQHRLGPALIGLVFLVPLLIGYGEVKARRVFLTVGPDGVYLGEVDDRQDSAAPGVHIPWDDVAAVVIHRVSTRDSDGDVTVRDAIGVRTHAPVLDDVTAADIVVHHRQTFTRLAFSFDHDRLRAAVAHFAPEGTQLIDVPELMHSEPQSTPPRVRVVEPGA